MEAMRSAFPFISEDYNRRLNDGSSHSQGACYPVHHELAVGFLLKLAREKEIPVEYFVDDSKWGFYNSNTYPLFENLVKSGVETRVVFPYEPPREDAFDLGSLERQFTNLKVRVLGLSREKELMNFLVVGDKHLWRTMGHESFRDYHLSLLYPQVNASVYINKRESDENSEKLNSLFEDAFDVGSPLY